jgi:general secretion pathway protein K
MRRQAGVAVITAVLIVAVAASAAAMMLAQQSAMIDQALMVSARAQGDLYAQAGVDWARGVLVEDLRRGRDVDTLDEAWSRPIAGLPVDRAVVAGALEDEQGKFNLNNLVSGGGRSAAEEALFRRLLALLSLPPDLADAVVDWIDFDHDLSGTGGAEDAYYLTLARPYRAPNGPMVQVEELYRVRGFDARSVERLRPYVTALPTKTTINANTASATLLAAVLGVTREQVDPLLAERRTKPFAQRNDFMSRIGALGVTSLPVEVDVKSSHFAARVQVTQDEVRLATEALVRRNDDGTTAVLWRRARY